MSDVPRPGLLLRVRHLLGAKFVRDTAVLQFGMLWTMGSYLVSSVLLARGLGPYGFGRYTEAFTLFTVIYFVANLGVTTATVSQYARACGQGDERGKTNSLAAFVKAYALMIAGIAVLGLALPAFAAWYYHDREVGVLALWLCALGPVQMVNAFVLVIMQGARRMRDFTVYSAMCDFMRLLLLLFALLGLYDITGVVVATIAAGMLNALIGIRMYRLASREAGQQSAPPALRDILRAVPKVRVRSLFSSSALIAVNKNGGELFRNFMLLFIGGHAGAASLGHFRVAYYYVWAIQQLLGGVSRNLLPSLGHRLGQAQGDEFAFKRDVKKVMWLAAAMFLSVTALFVLVAPIAVGVLYGPQYRDATPLVYLLALGHIGLAFAVVNEPVYIYTHRLRSLLTINLFIYGVCLPTGYLLTDHFGVVGGAITIAIAQLLNLIHFGVVSRYLYRGPTSAAPAA